jgi:hypothetical protein
LIGDSFQGHTAEKSGRIMESLGLYEADLGNTMVRICVPNGPGAMFSAKARDGNVNSLVEARPGVGYGLASHLHSISQLVTRSELPDLQMRYSPF